MRIAIITTGSVSSRTVSVSPPARLSRTASGQVSDVVAAAVFESWRLDLRMIFALLASAWIYVRGWRQLHRQMPSRYTTSDPFSQRPGNHLHRSLVATRCIRQALPALARVRAVPVPAEKTGHFDCTFCLDCVHACPSGNVGVLASPPGLAIGRLARLDIAALVLLLVFGAFLNAACMTMPVIQWMNEWQSKLGFASRAPVVAVFYFVGLFIPLTLGLALFRDFAGGILEPNSR